METADIFLVSVCYRTIRPIQQQLFRSSCLLINARPRKRIWFLIISKGSNRNIPPVIPDIHETNDHRGEDPRPWYVHVVSKELCTLESSLVIQKGVAHSLLPKEATMILFNTRQQYLPLHNQNAQKYFAMRWQLFIQAFSPCLGNSSMRHILELRAQQNQPPHFSGSSRKAANARFWHKVSAMSMNLPHTRGTHAPYAEQFRYQKKPTFQCM